MQLTDREPRQPAAWVRYVTTDGDVSWLRLTSLPASDAEWVLFFVTALLVQLGAILVGLVVASRATGARVRSLGLLLALANAVGMCVYYAFGVVRGIGGDEKNIGEYLGVPATLVAATFAIAAPPKLPGLPSGSIRRDLGRLRRPLPRGEPDPATGSGTR